MTHRIEVGVRESDTRAQVVEKKLHRLGFRIDVLGLLDVYMIDSVLSPEQLGLCASVLANPVIEQTSVDAPLVPDAFRTCLADDWIVEVGFKPGVTDNSAATTRETLEETLGKLFGADDSVSTSQVYFLRSGMLSRQNVADIAERLANPLIHRIHFKSREEFLKDKGMGVMVPRVTLQGTPTADSVNLDLPDNDLVKLGRQGVPEYDSSGKEIGHRGTLALDLASVHAIRDYFRGKGRQPTDVEVESIAQTWSEHCKHTIFAAIMDDLPDGLFKTYIKSATEQVRKARGAKDFCRSVFVDNSGAIRFDDRFDITHKVETHNSPSALDPFGGAITGIVGVNRDAIGFGLGAKPIANTYGFCFGFPEESRPLFRGTSKSNPALLPERIMEGVIDGVRVGGNCSGIPTPQGFMYFDDRYRGKPLVFVGTVGLIPREIRGQPSNEKCARPGDKIVMVGGRVGLDGIHGATFSSEALDAGSPATAVQIGDPITQKKLSDAIIKEARDRDLYTSITDNGAGGLSCSVAEMARESNGCQVNLDKVPTKYPGLQPWQIWISESQERMTLAVPPESVDVFVDLMLRRGVVATVIGEFTDSGKCVVQYDGKTVMDVELEFLHDGMPKKTLTTTFTRQNHDEPSTGLDDLTTALHDMLGRHNLCSKEFIAVQYDHEVQAGSVIKPVVGKGRVMSPTTVTCPVLSSYKGVALSQAVFPSYGDIDTYAMAACAIDAAVRNIIAVGGTLDHLALLDNFCWCSSDEPQRLGQLKRAAQACYDIAVAYGTPFISGKDSMSNDFKGFDENNNPIKISVPPTVLISTIGVVSDARACVSMEFKQAGDVIYVVGDTKDELGGSEYFALLGEQTRGEPFIGNRVPAVDPAKNIPVYRALMAAIEHGTIASAHAVAVGGIGASLALCSIGGRLGVDIEVSHPFLSIDRLLFSESTGRFVVSVAPENASAFESLMNGAAYMVGRVRNDDVIAVKSNGSCVIDTTVGALEQSYKERFAHY